MRKSKDLTPEELEIFTEFLPKDSKPKKSSKLPKKISKVKKSPKSSKIVSVPKPKPLQNKKEIEPLIESLSDDAVRLLKAIGIVILSLFGLFIIKEVVKEVFTDDRSDKDKSEDESEPEEKTVDIVDSSYDDDDDDEDYSNPNLY